MDRLEISISGI